MVRPRVEETSNGIQGEFPVEIYDQMMRHLRDKGWIETKLVIRSGIERGRCLEIGPGPGYLGLEWLRGTDNTSLTALEISPAMIEKARSNAKEYGLEVRATYVEGDAQQMPFEDAEFDAIFTNGSLHEWAAPEKVFDEVFRCLKPGGKYFISDMRRDMAFPVKCFMRSITKPKDILPGLNSSMNAAYTVTEILAILGRTKLESSEVKKTTMGFQITGEKRLS